MMLGSSHMKFNRTPSNFALWNTSTGLIPHLLACIAEDSSSWQHRHSLRDLGRMPRASWWLSWQDGEDQGGHKWWKMEHGVTCMGAAFLRSFHNYRFPLQKGGGQLGSTYLCSTAWVQVAESRNDHTYISSAVSTWRWTHGGASFLQCFLLIMQEDDAGSKTAHCPG